MFLPYIDVPQTHRFMTDVFYGYNHNLKIQQGESFHQKNITLDHYPVLSQRRLRGFLHTLDNPQGLIAKDALAWVDGDTLYYNGYPVEGIQLSTDPADCPKQMVSMGAYLVVFPDGFYVNTQDLTDAGSINATFNTIGTVSYALCDPTGQAYNLAEMVVSPAQPDAPANGDYWLDTSNSPNTLKQYSAQSDTWATVPTVYVKITNAGIGQLFEKGDGIHIEGATYSGESENMTTQISALNSDFVIQAKGDDYIVVTGIISQAYAQEEGTITVTRKAPKMDFVIESNNRLWGCRYGMTDGKMVNEIYASKLGDFKNWRVYAGISTDSYAVSVGSDGAFTGAITYNNYPFFFKEDCVHQIYGMMPAQYQVVHSRIPGVQKDSPFSLVNESGHLFYKSPMGVCRYDGSNAAYISGPLGEITYKNCSAGQFRGKVYFSMQRPNDEWEMLVYDSVKGYWTREDSTHARFFTPTEYDLFFVDGKGRVACVMGTMGDAEKPIEWEVVSGHLGYEYPDQKYMSRFNLRMSLTAGSTARLYIQYDSNGAWIPQGGEMTGHSVRTFTLPVIPRRCDHLQWMLKGRGDVKLYSVAKVYESGSDVV